jgi:hypothetical protein
MGERRYFLRSVGVLLAVAVGLAAGCEKDPSDGATCDRRPKPSFALQLESYGKALPPDTELLVTFGAGEERWKLAAPPQRPRVVFCTVGNVAEGGVDAAEDSGDDAGQGEVRALRCELWTDGAASVTISGGSFEALERALVAERDDCGPRTVPVTLQFGIEPEGGAGE